MVPCDRAAQFEMYDGSYADRQGMISPSVQIPVERIRHMALSVAGQATLKAVLVCVGGGVCSSMSCPTY
jgi:hypothetical protein